LLYKGILAIHIIGHAIGVFGSKLLFEFALRIRPFGMGDHVVAKSEVADGLLAASRKGVDLMCPHAIRVILSKVAAAGNTEFAHYLVPELFHPRADGVKGDHVNKLDQDIYDRFCIYPGDRRAANVMDSDGIIAEHSGNDSRLGLK
jgi:hypothetical protein